MRTIIVTLFALVALVPATDVTPQTTTRAIYLQSPPTSLFPESTLLTVLRTARSIWGEWKLQLCTLLAIVTAIYFAMVCVVCVCIAEQRHLQLAKTLVHFMPI